MFELNEKKMMSGAVWKLLERTGAQLVTLAVSIILARILEPEDYSIVSLVTIFFSFANILISGGLNTALIQKKDPDEEDYSTVLYISVFLSFLFYVVIFFTAPLLAKLYHSEMIVPIIRVMGLSLPITAIKSIWCAYISSNMLFRKFFFATIGGTFFSAIIGIIMALNGAGAWALVVQQMSNTIIDTVILIITTKVPLVFRISFYKFKALFKYAWKVLFSSILGAIYNEIVPMIIGIKYTSTDLAYYTKGRSFPSFLSSTATYTLSAVLFPALSKCQDEKEKLLNYTRWFIRLSSFLAFPMMLGFFAVSENFIEIVLTDKWLPAMPYIQIFCVVCMFDVIHVGNCETIKAMGRSDIYLIMELIKKSGYFITILLFLKFTNSPQSLAMAFLLCSVIAIIVNSIPNKKLIGYKFRYQISDLLPNLLTAGIMCICVMIVGKIETNRIVSLLLQVIVGVIVYLLLNLLIQNKSLFYILRMLQERDRQSE